MRIQVRRTGGFAGIERFAEIDVSGRADADGWRELAVHALTNGRSEPSRGVPDGFSYEISVDGTTVHASEPRLTDAQRELVSRVLREGA
ncbi:protealysin inhibitor emfourin [Streptomyces sp. NBC_00690]|uniref:protealysin inhibitor emfourin n=1 Tax=Streptomyces sp. NBC_00690 TaxID=2975808 RepID=UPI002E2A62B7|nr:protealysin inhibitor emfourin [Streptomyces sp. NBC_00690]